MTNEFINKHYINRLQEAIAYWTDLVNNEKNEETRLVMQGHLYGLQHALGLFAAITTPLDREKN